MSYLGSAKEKVTKTVNSALGELGIKTPAGKINKNAWSIGGHYKKGVDARLTGILSEAAQRFAQEHPGYSIKATSGKNARKSGTAWHPGGIATDVQITDPSGTKLGNYRNAKSFRTYEQFAQTARQVQQESYPELDDHFTWGGYFGGSWHTDQMHFDLGPTSRTKWGSWEKGLTKGARKSLPGYESVGIDQIDRAPLAAVRDSLPQSMAFAPTSRPARSREVFDSIAAGKNITATPAAQTAMRDYGWTGGVNPGQSVAGIDPNTPGVTRGLSTFDVARAITPGQAQARVAQERARVAAETEANKSVFTKAGEQVAGIKDTLGGFFDSLTSGQAAVAAAPHPNAPANFSTPKTDRLARTPTATYADVMAGKPVKTTSITGIPEANPAAIYDDPRALAYAQKMTPEPVNSLNVPVDPTAVVPDQPVNVEEPAHQVRQRARTVTRNRHPQITVNRPSSFTPSMPGGTLGGIRADERYSVGTGTQGITAALGGARGATGFSRSNLGVSVTNRGAHLGTITHNEKYGTDTFRDTSGNVTGTHYSQPGGFLGALGRSFGFSGGGGASYGGKSSSGSSSGGRSNSSGGKSNGARGAAGGSLGQSQRSL